MRRHMTRRQIMRAGGVTALGATGAAILAACGEAQVVTVEKIVTRDVPVEKIIIKEVPVETVVTKTVTKEVPIEVIKEVAAMRPAVKIEHATDHTSGPRGKAMTWALERYQQLRPDVKVKFIPQDHIYYEKIAIEAVAGTLSESNLLNGVSYQQFIGAGIWLEINGELAKRDDFDPENYHFQPDIYSDNREQDYPYNSLMHGPQHGMPYQGAIGGLRYNITALEAAGVDAPTEGWRYADLLEAAKRVRDEEAGIWGIRATRSEQFQMFPQMYGYNDGQARVDGPDGHQIWGPPLDGGAQGFTDIVDYIHKHGVAYPAELRGEIAGEFGDPFSAGTQVFDVGGGVYGSGSTVPRVAGRFSWSLAPMPWGDVTDHANFEWNDQPHIVASTAAVTGVEEQAVDWVSFLAGPEVQNRVGIDRGHLPVWKDTANEAASTAAPPEGQKYLYSYINNDYVRAMQWYVPGGFMSEVRAWWRPPLDGALVGDTTADEAMEQAQRQVNEQLRKFQADLDSGQVNR